MNIRPADGRHGHPHQNLPALGRAHGKLLENERCVWRLVYGSLGGTHCAERSLLSHYPDGPNALFDSVQCEVENIVIVQRLLFRTLAIARIQRPRQQERNLLLAEAAM